MKRERKLSVVRRINREECVSGEYASPTSHELSSVHITLISSGVGVSENPPSVALSIAPVTNVHRPVAVGAAAFTVTLQRGERRDDM